jgi:Flp pilus assembly protein TadD
MGSAAVDRQLAQAVSYFNTGNSRPARTLCADVLADHPDHLPALHFAAVIAFAEGRTMDGRDLLGRAFRQNPNYAPALVTLSDALAVQGEDEAALAVLRRAAALRPFDASLHAKLGVALSMLARASEAETAYRRALELDPTRLQARFNLATALAAQRRFAEAERTYRDVIAREPSHQGALVNLGNLLAQQNRPADAVMAYRQALQHDGTRTISAGDTAALTNLAACLCELGQLDEAKTACERALSQSPDDAPALTNLGIILDAEGRFEDAVAAHRRAIAVHPNHARSHANLAVALRVVGALDEARVAAQLAVTLDPDDPEIRFNHAHVLLMNGELARGFEELRWGRACRGWSDGYPVFAEPEWNGEPLAGRTLLLYAEAGLGDAMQFVRYLPMLRDKGGLIVLQMQPALLSLLRAMPGVTVVARGEQLPRFDVHLPLIGLPRVFGTTLESIPASIPYLQPDAAKLARWRSLPGDANLLKVGVVWAGNPRHKGDRQRSITADHLLPQLLMPGVKLFSLQKEVRAADAPALAALGGNIVDLAPMLEDFSDTAAAIACLDLVIAVDTSVAHLAGALGRPVWLLLPYALDWRWLRDREDTPWYPSMRLFRQRTPLVWDDVIARAARELARFASGQHQPAEPASDAR